MESGLNKIEVFRTLSGEQLCPLTENFLNRPCAIDEKLWETVCPMTAEMEKMENPLDVDTLSDDQINTRIDVLNEGTEQLILKNEKMIDEHIKINGKNKILRWLTGDPPKFDENGISRNKNSNKNSKRSWSLLRSKFRENKGEWNGAVFNYKNKNVLQCKGWEKLKNQFGSYWKVAKEVWDEFKKKPLDPHTEKFFYNEEKFEKFREEGIKFFEQICEREYISKEKCNSIDVDKVKKPPNFSQVINNFGKLILKTLIDKKVYSPLPISDETLALIKAILTKKDFLHPTLEDQIISRAQVGIRNKRMIGFGTVLNTSLIVTKITVITLLSVGSVLGLVMIFAAVHFCIH
uniref:Uncharacterized protein n=1 Tax=Meloidogyne hapla TaxID=6305 RepID=A0A1I8BLP1_MELHA